MQQALALIYFNHFDSGNRDKSDKAGSSQVNDLLPRVAE